MDVEWRFAGRSGELEQVRGLLRAQGSRGVVLAGPPGSGVTRFAAESLRLAVEMGMRALGVSATEAAATIAFGALAPLVSGVPDSGLPSDARLRWYADALAECANGARLALAVRDAHLLDPASAALVHHLASTNRGFVIVTTVSGAPCADAVLNLWKDELLPRIDLGRLSRTSVGEVLRAALGGRVSRSVAAHFYERSAGDMVLLRELTHSALREGLLKRDGDGPWTLRGPAPLSPRLVEIIEMRLRPLTPAQRAYLEVVAVAEPAGLVELRTAGNPAIADALERCGMLSSRRHGRRVEFRIAHPLYREVIRSKLPAMRGMAIAAELAENLEASGTQRPEDIVRMAIWRLEAGNASAPMLLEAAQIARWRFDLPVAERLALAAAEDGAGFEAELLGGQIAGLLGNIGDAESSLSRLERQVANDDQRGRLAMARIDNLTYDLGRLSDALAIADRAEAELPTSGLRDEIAARRLALLLAIQGPAVAAQAGEALVAHATGRALAWGCVELAYSWGRLGRLTDALALSELGHRAHQELTEPFEWSPWMHRFLRGDNLAHLGDLAAIEKLAETEHDKVVHADDLETQAFFALYLAKVVGDRGHVADSIAHAEEALELFRRLGRLQMIRFGLIYLALARALAGQADAAAEVLREIDEMRMPTNHLTGIDLYQARAWAAAAAGEIPQAREILEDGARVATRIGDRVGEAAALHSVARLGGRPAGGSRLRELCDVVDGQLIVARADHVDALCSGDAAGLAHVSGSFESMGADLLAAEAAADASVAWRRSGDSQRASAASWRAHVLSDIGGRARTPALGNLDARAVLTRAQRDVGHLAAMGKRNHDIAEQLAVSVRTVENHLQQVYRKLGLKRSDLAKHFIA